VGFGAAEAGAAEVGAGVVGGVEAPTPELLKQPEEAHFGGGFAIVPSNVISKEVANEFDAGRMALVNHAVQGS